MPIFVRVSRGFVLVGLIMVLLAIACGGSASERLSEAASTSESTTEQGETTATTNDAETTVAAEEVTEGGAAPTTELPSEAPTEEPAATMAPEWEPLVLESQGFGQDGQSASYGFIVRNPNEAVGFENVDYQVAVTDEAGTVLATDSGFITVALPGETLGIGGTLYVDEGQTIAAIEVQLSDGDTVPGDPVANFTTDRVQFLSDQFTNTVTGIIASPFNRTFEDVRVSAITYSSDGVINGGGFTFVNFVPAGGTTGASVSVTSSGEVARAELYPSISALSLLGNGESEATAAQALELVSYGFGEDDFGIGYGFLVRNLNTTESIENGRFRLTVFDADGKVIGTDEGYLNLLLPEQTWGHGGSLFTSGEAAIGTIEVQVSGGDLVAAEGILPFSTENVAFVPGDFTSEVTGSIINPYPEEVTDLRVTALAYDEADQIIGGGFTFLDFVPPQGSSAVSVTISVGATPARVELYASLSSLSEIGQ